MTYLTATELSDMRDDAEATLPDTCTIEYLTNTPDGMGGQSPSWTARGTAIPCRIEAAGFGSNAAITQEQLQEGQVWTLTLPYDQTVAHSDRVTKGGNFYQVQQINTDESELMFKRVSVVRWVAG